MTRSYPSSSCRYSSTRALIVVAALTLSSLAHAGPTPTCSYSAPYFANGVPGDVVVYPTGSVNPFVQVALADMGEQWGHVAAIANSAGSLITENTASGDNIQEGGCALPIDVYSLQNISPGISTNQANGSNVTILKNAVWQYCNYAYGGYKLHGLTTYIPNGVCASYLTASCGASSTGGYNLYTGNAVPDVYTMVYNMVYQRAPWYYSLGCGGVSVDQAADRGAMQVLNEVFFGTGDQNYNYYYGYQWPDPSNHASWAWPQYVSPGPTPGGIYNAHYGTKYTGQSASSTWTCTCPYGYYYNTAYGTCDPLSISYVYDYATGAGWTAHGGNYIAIYGAGFSTNSNVVWLGTTNLTVTYHSPTQINAWVPSTIPGGYQSLQVTNPVAGSVFANLQVYAACTPTTSCAAYGYTCGQIWNGCQYETCGYYGGGCPSGQTCNGNTCVAACQPYTSCGAYGYTCGQIWNGCQYETCGYYGGGCPSGQTCSGNTCVYACQPYASCYTYGYTCGSMWNGCYYETCGYYGGGCPSGQTCNGNTCVSGESSNITGEYNASTYAYNDAQIYNYITVWGNGLSSCSYLYLGGQYQYISYTSPNQVNAYVYGGTYTGWQTLQLYCNGNWTNGWSVYVHY
jgi:hypothetical protein